MNCKRIFKKIDIMNKKEYIAPAIKITVCDLQDSFLAGSGNMQWQPEQNGSTPNIKEEGKDGMLPDEITGSKEHNGSWNDSWD